MLGVSEQCLFLWYQVSWFGVCLAECFRVCPSGWLACQASLFGFVFSDIRYRRVCWLVGFQMLVSASRSFCNSSYFLDRLFFSTQDCHLACLSSWVLRMINRMFSTDNRRNGGHLISHAGFSRGLVAPLPRGRRSIAMIKLRASWLKCNKTCNEFMVHIFLA